MRPLAFVGKGSLASKAFRVFRATIRPTRLLPNDLKDLKDSKDSKDLKDPNDLKDPKAQ